MNYLGNALLLLAELLIIYRLTLPGLYSYKQLKNKLLYLHISIPCLIIASFLCLVASFIRHDFSLLLVYNYSSTLKPLIYRIAASWSNHEGSMLMWSSLIAMVFLLFHFITYTSSMNYAGKTKSGQKTSIFGKFNSIFLSANEGDKNIYELTCRYMLVIIFLFILFNLFIANPFTLTGFTPSEGFGLNPILQDIALAIHPPILYTGYSIIMLTYCVTLASLSEMQAENRALLDIIRSWNILAWCLITAGVTLGSWWAYRELGWGGFWFFDPVENISLLPWITSLMSLHLLKLSALKPGYAEYARHSVFSSLLMLLLGSMLVRSGLLTSVHSFAIASWNITGFGLIIYVASHIYIGLDKQYKRYADMYSPLKLTSQLEFSQDNPRGQKYDNTQPQTYNSPNNKQATPLSSLALTSKTGGIILSQALYIGSLAALLCGIIIPVISPAISGFDIFLGPEYFYGSFLPFFPMLLFLGGFTSYNSWSQPQTRFAGLMHLALLAICAVLGYLLADYFSYSRASLAGIITATGAIYFASSSLIAWGWSLTSNIPAILSHIGFAMLVASILVISAGTRESDITLKPSETHQFTPDISVKLVKVGYSSHANYFRHIALLEFFDTGGNEITSLEPERRLYVPEMGVISETALYSSTGYDLGAVMTNNEEQAISFRIFYKPAMFWLWLSGFILAYSSLLTFINCIKRQRV